MRKFIFGTAIMLLTVALHGQERKSLALSVSAGKLTSPYFRNNQSGKFFNIDFDYYLTKRHILSASYNDGRHNYYDDNLVNNSQGFIKSDGTNSIAKYHTFSILYKYKFVDKRKISVALGAGAGIMTHSKLYPDGYVFQESTWTDLVFPVRLEFDYTLPKNFRIGLMGGLFVAPDFPVLAYHIGPRLSYLLK